MKLIVGLGNRGQKYDGTRHNVGFEAIASLARRYDVGRPKSKFNAEVVETIIGEYKAVLMCPLTFMNLSGQSVRAAFDFYKLSLDDLLVICDDMNLKLARLRMRPKGSAGGQNGLRDIIGRLGSQEFCRLRIGIDRPPQGWDTSDYVLGKFKPENRQAMESSCQRAAEAAEYWVKHGIQKSMSQFNPDPEEIRKRAERKLEARRKKEEQKRLELERQASESSGDNADTSEPKTDQDN